VLLGVLMLAGCANNPPGGDVYDPIEPVNRGVYDFNEMFYDQFLSPFAALYRDVTPAPARRGITNFFDNATYPGVVINQVLQGKFESATRGTIRFVINTTVGLGGLLDPATAMGLEAGDEDLGQTLGYYGAGSGPYLVLPILGPSNLRDVTSYPAGLYTSGLNYVPMTTPTAVGVTTLRGVNTYSQLERAGRIRDEAALDPYAFTRSAYEQRRRSQIYDGNPPQAEDPYGDFFNNMDNGGSSEPGGTGQ
jgi:phospholipid-binding lipoprotein MlaA